MERDKYYEVRNRDDVDKLYRPNTHTVIVFGYLGDGKKYRLSVDVIFTVNTPHDGHYYPQLGVYPKMDDIQFVSAYSPMIEKFYSLDCDISPDDVIRLLERNGFKPMGDYS